MSDEYELGITLTNSFRLAVQKLRETWEEAEAEEDPVRKTEMFSRFYRSASQECWSFCNSISSQMEVGYRLGSRIICSFLTGAYVPVGERPEEWRRAERDAEEDGYPMCWGVQREVRSVILTALTLWPFETRADRGEPLRGRRVSHIARMMNRTAGSCARMYVEWFEDMGEGIPMPAGCQESDDDGREWVLEPQPTRVLRGVLFATKLGEGVMDDFWKMAARSESFPGRIFTDPGDHKSRNCLLPPTQFAQLAEFCMRAPEEAVVRFAHVYRDAVLAMKTITYGRALFGTAVEEVAVLDAEPGDALALFPDRGINPELVCDGDLTRVDLEVTEAKRRWLLETAVLSHVYKPERHKLVRNIFFPEVKEEKETD